MTSWRKALLWALLVAGAIFHAMQWRFVCDDAYIALRYAQHWGQEGSLAYNLGQDPVEGFTSPLWVALLAVGAKFGAPLAQMALLLNALGSAVLGIVCVALARGGLGARAGALAAGCCALFLLLCPEFIVWSSGGLETSVAAALGMGAILAHQRHRVASFHALASLAVCARLDAAPWILAFALTQVQAPRVVWRRKSAAWWLMVLALFVARWRYFGQWLPQTFAVKSGGYELAQSFGLAYLRAWLVPSGLWAALLVAPLGLFGLRGLLAVIVVQVGYVLAVGGDFMGYSRFLLPATCASIILASRGLARGYERSWHPRWRVLWPVSAGLAALLLAGLAVRRVQRDRAQNFLEQRLESVDAMERFAAVRLAAGRAFAQRWPAGTRATVGAAGAFPFASRLTVYDAYGLTDRSVLSLGTRVPATQARPGHQIIATKDWARHHAPQLRCEIGMVAKRHPSQAQLRQKSPLSKDAQWFCASTGEVQLRTRKTPLSARLYCCVQEGQAGS